MKPDLLELLRKISPTGQDGFEGLIAALLESLTGRHFQRAIGGSQAGRDMSSRQSSANVIAAECKRYKNDTDLSVRELLGEMDQAMATSLDLDLWVLVASRDIPSQLHEELYRHATDHGISYFAISSGDGTPSTLEVLCAHSPQIFINHPGIKAIVDEENIRPADLEDALDEIRRQTPYQSRLSQLQEAFSASSVGYENWRIEQNRWFLNSVQSADEARAVHGQILNVEESGTLLIKRNTAWLSMDQWLENWKTSPTMMALLGEEGDGKTWSVASWLATRSKEITDFPAVVFLTSTDHCLTEIGLTDPSFIFATAVSRCLPNLTEVQVQRRLKRWFERPQGQNPLMILVLDGINERHEASWWRGILEQLPSDKYRHIAVIVTCRSSFWNRHFSQLKYLPVSPQVIPPYDDDELNTALLLAKLDRKDIQETVLPLIRKPRYFDLMVQHHEHVAQSGDITVARLIYEDWRDRYGRKRAVALPDDDFQSVIRQLAQASSTQKQLSSQTVADSLTSFSDQQQIIQELQTGGILQPSKGKFVVNERMLIYGFGLLLVDEIEQSVTAGQDVRETIASWLEPHSEIDLKAGICEFAALHALEIKTLSQEAKVALLESWIGSQNPGEGIESNLTSYLPLDPQTYVALAESVWSKSHENRWAQDALMDAFRHKFEIPNVSLVLHDAFERWLGFIHIQGSPSLRRGEHDQSVITGGVASRLGSQPTIGVTELAGYPLTIIDNDGLLRLGRMALAIISHNSRQQFIRTLTIGCLAEEIMGRAEKYDLFAWVIRTSPEEVQRDLCNEAEKLLAANNDVTSRVADRLLSFEGSPEAEKIRDLIPETIFPPRLWPDELIKDICTSIFTWSAEDCVTCLQRPELEEGLVATKIAPHCINPGLPVPESMKIRFDTFAENLDTATLWFSLGQTEADYNFKSYEPVLTAYRASKLASVICSLSHEIVKRREMPQRQLSISLNEHYLVLTEVEFRILQEAWEHLIANSSSVPHIEDVTERYLYKILLSQMDGDEQIASLLRRSETSFDWLDFEKSFLPVSNWEFIEQQLAGTTSKTLLSRILWFLTTHAETIPETVLCNSIMPLLHHKDSYLRSLVLELIVKNKSAEVNDSIVNSEWAWNSKHVEQENHWGSIILCEHGAKLSFEEICRRIEPNALGYAIKCRGTQDDEVNTYADLIQKSWLSLAPQTRDSSIDASNFKVEYNASADSPHDYRFKLAEDLSTRSITMFDQHSTWGGSAGSDDIDLTEISGNAIEEYRQKLWATLQEVIDQQGAAGNSWFGKNFHCETLDKVIEIRPDLVEQWIYECLPHKESARNYLYFSHSFYLELCICLLINQVQKGLYLYWILDESHTRIKVVDGDTNIDLLDFTLFKILHNSESEKAWERKLEGCITDQELMSIAILAEYGTAQDWLLEYIRKHIESTTPLDRARAIVLLGLLETEEANRILESLPQPFPENWAGRLIKRTTQRLAQNTWAKHWFTQFVIAEDDVTAWAAFRLLLRCIDRRFWFWHKKIENNVTTKNYTDRRKIFLLDQRDRIQSAIKENEKDLKECFLGQKLMQGQVWPWM